VTVALHFIGASPGEKGKKIDNYFSAGIKTLRERGEYDKVLATVLAPYIEWQP